MSGGLDGEGLHVIDNELLRLYIFVFALHKPLLVGMIEEAREKGVVSICCWWGGLNRRVQLQSFQPPAASRIPQGSFELQDWCDSTTPHLGNVSVSEGGAHSSSIAGWISAITKAKRGYSTSPRVLNALDICLARRRTAKASTHHEAAVHSRTCQAPLQLKNRMHVQWNSRRGCDGA